MAVQPLAAQWAAARALAEGALPTHARIAAVLGVAKNSIATRASRETWMALDFRWRDAKAAQAALIGAARGCAVHKAKKRVAREQAGEGAGR